MINEFQVLEKIMTLVVIRIERERDGERNGEVEHLIKRAGAD